MLDQHPNLFAAGELSNLWWTIQAGGHCQCGNRVGACPFWVPVANEALRKAGLTSAFDAEALRLAAARTRYIWRARSRESLSGPQGKYVALLRILHNEILVRSGAEVLVDTSKKAVDLLLVARATRTAAVHLTRSPYGVAASARDQHKFPGVPSIDRPPSRRVGSSAILWILGNYLASFAERCLQQPMLQASYESLVSSPAEQLDRIVELLGLGRREWEIRGEEFNFGSQHIVNGNPSRRHSGWQALHPPGMGHSLTPSEKLLVRSIVALGSARDYDSAGSVSPQGGAAPPALGQRAEVASLLAVTQVDLADAYLDIVKKHLTRGSYRAPTKHIGDPRWEVYSVLRRVINRFGLDLVIPIDRRALDEGQTYSAESETMIGLKRLDNIQHCVSDVLKNDVPGDLIETGVWRGGGTIFMRAVLSAYGETERKVWVADSFQGLPKPEPGRYPADRDDRLWRRTGLVVSLEEVKENFARYGLLDGQVEFLKGWFADTLPAAPIERLAVMRLDGDMYQSTMEALEALYPKLSVGGYVIIDDFGVIAGCRQAVTDFRAANAIVGELHHIDASGVYWQRTSAVGP